MFTKTIKATLIAASVMLGAVATTSSSANAEVRGGIYFEGPGVSIGFGDYRDRRGRLHDGWEGPRRDLWERYNRCSPRKAVRKASRKGIRRAHVVRVNRRGVIVAGRKWGERVVVGFRSDRRCSVRFVRARHW